jgi:hypothetical protein
MTLEDETGYKCCDIGSVFQRCSALAKTVSFLGITATLQVEVKRLAEATICVRPPPN